VVAVGGPPGGVDVSVGRTGVWDGRGVSVGGAAVATGEGVPNKAMDVIVLSLPPRRPAACTMLALLWARVGVAPCATTSASPIATTISATAPRNTIAARSLRTPQHQRLGLLRWLWLSASTAGAHCVLRSW